MNKQLIGGLVLALSLGSIALAKDEKKQTFDLAVTDNGFEPSEINAKPGSDVVLNITRKTDSTCATSITVPSKKVKVELPLNKTVTVALGKLDKGEIKFGCAMNMMVGGMLHVK